MNSQGVLFQDRGLCLAPAAPPQPPYQKKSATSRAGAECIAPRALNLRQMLLHAMRGAGQHGLTISEAAAELTRRRGAKVKESTVCGRLAELREEGRVVDSGRTRVGEAGVSCTVWIPQEIRS